MTDGPLIKEQTIKYKTYLLQALIESVQAVFANHPDDLLRYHTNVSMDLPMERAQYPSVVIRFYEREIINMGLGHVEWLQNPNGMYQPYKHFKYTGDIEFAIYALSSYDRLLLADSITQIATMSDLEYYTNLFGDRIYNDDSEDALFNFINFNSDRLSGFGETQIMAPWMPEDTLVYQTSYRTDIMGEFYSRPLEAEYELIENIDVFPYWGPDNDGPDPTPEGTLGEGSEWVEVINLTSTTDNG